MKLFKELIWPLKLVTAIAITKASRETLSEQALNRLTDSSLMLKL
jgi:hypothetical protein